MPSGRVTGRHKEGKIDVINTVDCGLQHRRYSSGACLQHRRSKPPTPSLRGPLIVHLRDYNGQIMSTIARVMGIASPQYQLDTWMEY